MRLTADRAVAYDLAGIVNPIGLPEDPAVVRRNQLVQFLHLAAIGGNEGVIVIAAGGREAHDRALLLIASPQEPDPPSEPKPTICPSLKRNACAVRLPLV